MPSLASQIGSKIANALGVTLNDGQITFSEGQVVSAQQMVRNLLNSKSSGKSVVNSHQNFRIFGIPILERYGPQFIFGGGSLLLLLFWLGLKIGNKNARSNRHRTNRR